MTDYFQDNKLFHSLTRILWQIFENILALAEGCWGPLPPYGGVHFWDNKIIHRIILTHWSLSTQIHDFHNLDYLANSALFWETVINSEFTKCGKDMAKCQRCTIREWLLISRIKMCFIVRLDYYGILWQIF